MTEDRRLALKAKNGDRDAFAQLAERYVESLCAVAYAITLDTDAAWDVTQEGLLRALNSLKGMRDPKRFDRWLIKIIRNVARDYVRKRRNDRTTPTDMSELGELPDAEIGQERFEREEDLARLVEDALRCLTEEQRIVVVLRYMEDMKSREIAERLGVTRATVDMRLMRARDRLNRYVEDAAEN
ncbi:MAG: sigma-70 family RNA polymerase sigma factor, partial [Candidatus Poribacteria bacterium]|nr:sigma-70 family RNA polymerase sigma factor [Candidatus Poribacteria bacterium]